MSSQTSMYCKGLGVYLSEARISGESTYRKPLWDYYSQVPRNRGQRWRVSQFSSCMDLLPELGM